MTIMKYLLSVIALLLLATPCAAQGPLHQVLVSEKASSGGCSVGSDIGNGWCQIATTVAGSGNSTSVTTTGINTTGADLIVVVVSSYCAAYTMVAADVMDSKSNTWTSVNSQCSSGAGDAGILMAYSKPSSVGASHTFTVTNVLPTFPTISVYAVSGSHASPLDQTTFNESAGATSLASNSITPSANNTLVVSGWVLLAVNSGTPTTNAGMSVIDYENNDGLNHQAGALARVTQATAGAINVTWSWVTSGAASVVIASFKHA